MSYIKSYSKFKINEELIDTKFPDLKSMLANVIKRVIEDVKNWKEGYTPDKLKSNINEMLESTIDGIISGVDKNVNTEENIMDLYDELINQISNYKESLSSAIKDVFEEKSEALVKISGDVIDALVKYLQNEDNKEKNFTKEIDKIDEKNPNDSLKQKKDKMRDILNSLHKKLTGLINSIDDNKLKIFRKISKFTYDQLLKMKEDNKEVSYKKDGYDDTKNPEEQRDRVGVGKMISIDKNKSEVSFKNDNEVVFTKKFEDILPSIDENIEISDKLKKGLGEIKKDTKNLKRVLSFVDYIQKNSADDTKMNQIDNIINQ